MTLNDIYMTIDENNNLDFGLKDNLKELVTIFNQIFPSVKLDNLASRLKNLKIEKSNKYVSKKILDYNPITNVITFNEEEIQKDYDGRFLLMNALLRMITANKNGYGFEQNNQEEKNKFRALNAGYTVTLANLLVGNNGNMTIYDDEVIATNMIAEIIGNDIFLEAYFTNNPSLIANAFLNENME